MLLTNEIRRQFILYQTLSLECAIKDAERILKITYNAGYHYTIEYKQKHIMNRRMEIKRRVSLIQKKITRQKSAKVTQTIPRINITYGQKFKSYRNKTSL